MNKCFYFLRLSVNNYLFKVNTISLFCDLKMFINYSHTVELFLFHYKKNYNNCIVII